MPRRPNTRPTNIYWLFDVRPETLATYPLGRPFYCGKTVQEIRYRLTAHKTTPKGGAKEMLLACGEYVRTELMEVVPVGGDWIARERGWIRTLRLVNPDCVNVADGGQGAPGNVRTEASKRLMSEKMKGRKFSPETIAKMSARMRGNPIRKGKKLSPEQSAALSASRFGKKRGPQSVEHREKIGAAQRGRRMPESQKAALRAAWVGRKARRLQECLLTINKT